MEEKSGNSVLCFLPRSNNMLTFHRLSAISLSHLFSSIYFAIGLGGPNCRFNGVCHESWAINGAVGAKSRHTQIHIQIEEDKCEKVIVAGLFHWHFSCRLLLFFMCSEFFLHSNTITPIFKLYASHHMHQHSYSVYYSAYY